MTRPRLLCLIFESIHSILHFRFRHSGILCKFKMNFITSCLLILLSCSFEACVLEVESVSALLLPVKHVALPMFSDKCQRLLPLRSSYVYFSKGMTGEIGPQPACAQKMVWSF